MQQLNFDLLVEQQMLWCRHLPFDATQHVGNLHEVIVDDIRKVVSRIAVGFYDNRISFVHSNVI